MLDLRFNGAITPAAACLMRLSCWRLAVCHAPGLLDGFLAFLRSIHSGSPFSALGFTHAPEALSIFLSLRSHSPSLSSMNDVSSSLMAFSRGRWSFPPVSASQERQAASIECRAGLRWWTGVSGGGVGACREVKGQAAHLSVR